MTQTNRLRFRRWAVVGVCALLAGGLSFWLLWSWSVPRPRLTLRAPVLQRLGNFSEDGNKLLAMSHRVVVNKRGKFERFSGPLRLWDLRMGQCEVFEVAGDTPDAPLAAAEHTDRIGLLQLRDSYIDQLTLASDGRTAAYLYVDDEEEGKRTYCLIHLAEPRELLRFENPWQGYASYSPDGRWFAVVTVTTSGDESTETLRLVDTRGWKEIRLPAAQRGRAPVFSPDNRFLAYSVHQGGQCKLVLWDLLAGSITKELPDAGPPLSFSPDSQGLLIRAENGLALIDVSSGQRRLSLQRDHAFHTIEGATFSPDGRRIMLSAFVHNAGVRPVAIFELSTRQRLPYFLDNQPLTLLDHGVDQAVKTFWWGCPHRGKQCEVVDLRTDELIGVWPPEHQPGLASLDAKFLVTGELTKHQPSTFWTKLYGILPGLPKFLPWEEHSLHIWDMRDLRHLAHLRRQWHGMISPDGRSLATYESEPSISIHIWDLPPRTPILRPLAWSLLVSLFVMLVGCWFVTRKRRKATA